MKENPQINTINVSTSFDNLNKVNTEFPNIHNKEYISKLLTNYNGSTFLQKELIKMNENQISILFMTILPDIANIMCLEYGNYFIQMLILRLNPMQRLIIYKNIEKDFLFIATNKRGTHCIQALIDAIQNPNEKNYLEILLNKNLLSIINSENGYHIIMKIILSFPEEQRAQLIYSLYPILKK